MRRKKRIKVIIDTNLWISFLIGKRLKILKDLIVENRIELIITDQLLDEIQLVTQRPKLKRYFPEQKVIELVNFLRTIGTNVRIKSEINICRDSKDNFLLSLSNDSKANLLITGDRDLLLIEKFQSTEIIDFKEFEKQMN